MKIFTWLVSRKRLDIAIAALREIADTSRVPDCGRVGRARKALKEIQ